MGREYNDDEYFWVEKYRPRKIEDCILPESLKETFSKMVETGELSNMTFSGTHGVGKTTVARALCHELDLDYIIIKGSEEGNIDTLRKTIRQFASTVSLSGGYKVVIIDEADGLNPLSTQPALRGFIEEFSNNCRFILTCNYKNKLLGPIHSRCPIYEFAIPKADKAKLAMGFYKRLIHILGVEGVDYDPKALAALVEKFFPDWRRVLMECQRYSVSGKIDAGALVNLSEDSMNALLGYLKKKEFTNMRKWVVDNIDLEAQFVFRGVYDRMYDVVEPSNIPNVVTILAEYQYKACFVADHEINTVACLTELMMNVEFK